MNYTEFKLEVMELGDFKVNKIPEKTVTVTYQNDTTQVMTISSDFKYAVDTNLISFVQLDSWAQSDRVDLTQLGLNSVDLEGAVSSLVGGSNPEGRSKYGSIVFYKQLKWATTHLNTSIQLGDNEEGIYVLTLAYSHPADYFICGAS